MSNTPVTGDNSESFDIEPEGTQAPPTQLEPPAFLLTADKTAAVRFQPSKPGYAFDQVEYFVDQVGTTLRFLELKLHEVQVSNHSKDEEIGDLQETISSLKATIEVFRANGDPLTAADGSYITESQIGATDNTAALTTQIAGLQAELAIARQNEAQAIEAERLLREYVDITLAPWLAAQNAETTQPEPTTLDEEPAQETATPDNVETETPEEVQPTANPHQEDHAAPADENPLNVIEETIPVEKETPQSEKNDNASLTETTINNAPEPSEEPQNGILENSPVLPKTQENPTSATELENTPATEDETTDNNIADLNEEPPQSYTEEPDEETTNGYNLTLEKEKPLTEEKLSSIQQQLVLSGEMENGTGDDEEENPVLKEEPQDIVLQKEITPPESEPSEDSDENEPAEETVTDEEYSARILAALAEANAKEQRTPENNQNVSPVVTAETNEEPQPTLEETPELETQENDPQPETQLEENSSEKNTEASTPTNAELEEEENEETALPETQNPPVVELPLPKLPPVNPAAKTPFGKAPEEPFEPQQPATQNIPQAAKPAFNRLAASPEAASLGTDIAIAETTPTRANNDNSITPRAAGTPLPKLLALSPEALAAQQAASAQE